MSEYLAADLLVDSLFGHGVERVFCVPGESYLSVLDSLAVKKSVEVITTRHESGAGFMALADAKLSGRPGVCFVSRGPGATNASIAIHSAQQDALPLVVFVGQVARSDLGRGAFQEIDYVKAWSGIAKWVWQVWDSRQLGEIVARAFQVAASPTPGPVVIVLPEDMLEDVVARETLVPPLPQPRCGADTLLCSEVLKLVEGAARPLIIAGQALNTLEGRAALEKLASQLEVPVAVTFRQQDMLPNDHASYAGHLFFNAPKALVTMLSETDLILAIGTRLGDVATQGYTFPATPVPAQKIIHVHDDPAHLGRNIAVELAINADVAAFCTELLRVAGCDAKRHTAWRDRVAGFVRNLNKWTPKSASDGVVFGEVAIEMERQLADDAIVCLDAGNFSGWVQKHFCFRGERRMVATIAGAMGSGVPSGVAASLRWPERQVVVVVGDGGFMMTGNELATACQYGCPVKIIVSDNGSYGTIRLHQELRYPGRLSATKLANPDFAALARAFGAVGFEVNSADQVASVLKEALAVPGPALICVKTSLDHIAAFTSLGEIAARQKKTA
jgi:acetolactate synthase-1/2/3 large subunit